MLSDASFSFAFKLATLPPTFATWQMYLMQPLEKQDIPTISQTSGPKQFDSAVNL